MIKYYLSNRMPVQAAKFSRTFDSEMFKDFARLAATSGDSLQMNLEGNLFSVTLNGVEMNKGDWLCRTDESGLFILPDEVFSRYFTSANEAEPKEPAAAVVTEAKANDPEDEEEPIEDDKDENEIEEEPAEEKIETTEELLAYFANMAENSGLEDIATDIDDNSVEIFNSNGTLYEQLVKASEKFEDDFNIEFDNEDVDEDDLDSDLINVTIVVEKK